MMKYYISAVNCDDECREISFDTKEQVEVWLNSSGPFAELRIIRGVRVGINYRVVEEDPLL